MAQELRAVDGELLAHYLTIYGSRCLHCGVAIGAADVSLALGAPYFGMLHINCWQHYSYPGVWPHPGPAAGFR